MRENSFSHATRILEIYLLISFEARFPKLDWCGRGEVGKSCAYAVDHRQDELFDLLGLNLGFGEELGGAEAELGHLDFGELAAGVNDERKCLESRLLTEPLDEREAIAVGEGQVKDEKVGRPSDAVANGLLASGGTIDANGGVAEAGGEDAGEIFVIFDEQNVGRTVPVMEDAAQLGEEEVLVEWLLDPTLGVAG
jgi:hypothetical protein